MKKTLFLGAMAHPKEKLVENIKAICSTTTVMMTDILAKWISLYNQSLSKDYPAIIFHKKYMEGIGFSIG